MAVNNVGINNAGNLIELENIAQNDAVVVDPVVVSIGKSSAAWRSFQPASDVIATPPITRFRPHAIVDGSAIKSLQPPPPPPPAPAPAPPIIPHYSPIEGATGPAGLVLEAQHRAEYNKMVNELITSYNQAVEKANHTTTSTTTPTAPLLGIITIGLDSISGYLFYRSARGSSAIKKRAEELLEDIDNAIDQVNSLPGTSTSNGEDREYSAMIKVCKTYVDQNGNAPRTWRKKLVKLLVGNMRGRIPLTEVLGDDLREIEKQVENGTLSKGQAVKKVCDLLIRSSGLQKKYTIFSSVGAAGAWAGAIVAAIALAAAFIPAVAVAAPYLALAGATITGLAILIAISGKTILDFKHHVYPLLKKKINYESKYLGIAFALNLALLTVSGVLLAFAVGASSPLLAIAILGILVPSLGVLTSSISLANPTAVLINNLFSKKREPSSQVGLLRSQLEEFGKNNEVLGKTIEKLKKKIADLKRQDVVNTDLINELQEKLKSYQQKLEESNEYIRELKTKLADSILENPSITLNKKTQVSPYVSVPRRTWEEGKLEHQN